MPTMTAPFARRLPRLVIRSALALGLAIGLSSGTAPTASAADSLPTVPHVDLGRYAGTWYEIARLPNWFQRSCERSRAEYTPCGDGTLKVVNTCVKAGGRSTSIEGRATPVACSGNARLRVRFGGLAAFVPVSPEGNYFVIALDDDYQWALVGTPDRRFLWILARQPQLDPAVYAQITRQACCLGFDVGSLVTSCR